MKSLIALLSLYFLPSLSLLAQSTYTGHLRTAQEGKGTVVVIQSDAIEQVVNNTPKSKGQATTAKGQTATAKGQNGKQPEHPTQKSQSSGAPSSAQHKGQAGGASHPATEGAQHTLSASGGHTAEGSAHNASASHPASPTKHYEERARHKAQGYRICIFTGGNSRADKNKAIQMGNKCRAKFGELAVYPSFIAPRWVTYVGDFRTHQEAQKYVALIRRARISYEVRVVRSEVNLPY